MSTKIKSLILIVAALAIVVSGCGPKAASSTSLMDSPEYHYKNGLKYLDKDQPDDAMKSFDRAVALDPKSPLGYIGRGLALGKKGEFKQAFVSMSKGKSLDKGIEANIGTIRLYSMQRDKGWVKDAEDEFRAAQKRDANSAPLHYYMGMAYKVALDFDKAATMFKAVLEMNKEFTNEANAEWALIQKIQRAAPGTEIGKKIALIDRIDRADIAALFDQEMNLEKLFTKRGVKAYDTTFKAPTESSTAMQTEKVVKMEAATDIANHWLKPSIDTVLKLQIRGLEAGPDHTFAPDKLVTKGEFALMLEDVLIKVSGDEKLATKFLGATSPFPDIRNDQYFFSAAMTAASRGYLEADKATGEFKPGDPVSGADALLSIRSFKDQLKF
ncbi:MAG TPA: S-layer homology domain-containing protein [Nitrospirota bacterium]